MSLQCLWREENARRLLPGVGILGLTNMYHGILPMKSLSLMSYWKKIEEFCKPQSNEVRAKFYLLTSFRQGERSIDEWYNVVQIQVALFKHPQETAKILHRDIFWFFIRDEEFVSKTINDSNIDLNKFPASKVRQPAKKMESSKATAKHNKQVASDPQTTQINLMCHQYTELPPSNFKRKQKPFKSREDNNKQYYNDEK